MLPKALPIVPRVSLKIRSSKLVTWSPPGIRRRVSLLLLPSCWLPSAVLPCISKGTNCDPVCLIFLTSGCRWQMVANDGNLIYGKHLKYECKKITPSEMPKKKHSLTCQLTYIDTYWDIPVDIFIAKHTDALTAKLTAKMSNNMSDINNLSQLTYVLWHIFTLWKHILLSTYWLASDLNVFCGIVSWLMFVLTCVVT